jgi:hypothetical protein
MATTPAALIAPKRIRHPMGLPRGSVRALLTFMVLGMIWLLLLLPEDKKVPVPIYLYYLMFLIIGHYFAARNDAKPADGHPEPSPLHLPRGSIRILIVLGFVGVFAYSLYRNPEFLERLKPSVEVLVEQPYLPLVLVAAFFSGMLVTRLANLVLAGPDGLPPWFQDLFAWVALVAVLGLTAEIVLQLIVFPSMSAENRIQLPYWQSILSGIIAFYFGARS